MHCCSLNYALFFTKLCTVVHSESPYRKKRKNIDIEYNEHTIYNDDLCHTHKCTHIIKCNMCWFVSCLNSMVLVHMHSTGLFVSKPVTTNIAGKLFPFLNIFSLQIFLSFIFRNWYHNNITGTAANFLSSARIDLVSFSATSNLSIDISAFSLSVGSMVWVIIWKTNKQVKLCVNCFFISVLTRQNVPNKRDGVYVPTWIIE